MQLVRLKRTKIVYLQFVSIYRKELSNFKTFLDMTKVFPSLPLLLISSVGLAMFAKQTRLQRLLYLSLK